MAACATCGARNPEDARFCSSCGTPLAREASWPALARKVVTVMFADVSGFTALGERLDPESLQGLMVRFFEQARAAVERHGGTVEKYIGDAVMAAFGAPVLHEDDHLRAARAALELRERLDGLNGDLGRSLHVHLRVRTGLNTGEVVVGQEPRGESFTTGDAVNVAQRLESAAAPGEVLISAATARLLAGSARLEPVAPLRLKGKTELVPAWRLLSVAAERAGQPARPAPPFVGRERELGLLRELFRDVAARRSPRLVTALGPPGIGKSRLVQTALAGMREEASVAVGRCLSYGEGDTYWALTEIVRQLAPGADEAALRTLHGGGEESAAVAARLARALGFAPGGVPVEEARWAARKLFEAVAQRRPLVVVVDDVHWAEPTLLDLLEHVAAYADEVPLLLLCLARPELLVQRPTWGGAAGERAETTALAPLTSEEATALLGELADGTELAGPRGARLLETAEGNPLFLAQLVAMRSETGADESAVPATIQALLSARIDALPAAEAALIQRASIEGRTFHRAALRALLPEHEHAALDAGLEALLQRELIEPAQPVLDGEQAHSFTHSLIREAAYGLLPKRQRADLHETYARWLERRVGGGPRDHGESVGFHLERAFRLRADLEPAGSEALRRLAAEGGRHLGAAGRAALARGDVPAAVNLLDRAVDLLPQDDAERGRLMPELGTALAEAGRLEEALALLRAAAARGAASREAAAEAHALTCELLVRLQVDTEAAAGEVEDRFEALRETFERETDELGLGRLWRLRALVHWIAAQSAHADRAWTLAAEHARRAGDEHGRVDALAWLASSAFAGPVPATEAIARCEAIVRELEGDRRAEAFVLHPLAGLHAMRGELERARAGLERSNAILAALGVTIQTAVSHHEAFVALAAGDAAVAEVSLRAGYERLVAMGERALLASTAALLARALREQGRLDESWRFTQLAEDAAASDDLSAQLAWRSVRAPLLAARGAFEEADRLSAAAVALAERSDWLSDHGDALVARAEVLRARGDEAGASRALAAAVSLYERKGNLVEARRARALLASGVPA